jgi:hypothetical protein
VEVQRDDQTRGYGANRRNEGPWLPRVARSLYADRLFLGIAGVALVFFVLAIPPGWGLDEQSHVARAYQVSEGTLLAYTREDGVTLGAEIPEELERLQEAGHKAANSMDRRMPWWERSDRLSADDIASLWRANPSGETVDYNISNASASSFVPYAPAAVGLWVGRTIALSTGDSLLLAEFFNAALYLVLAWAAVRVLRGYRAQWLAFALALLPSAIIQASYITADTYTNAVSILFVALVARLCLNRVAPRRWIVVATALAGIGVVVSKPSYAILLAILLAVPPSSVLPVSWTVGEPSRDRRRGYWLIAGYLVTAATITFGVLRSTSSAANAISAMYDRGADPSTQLAGMIADPIGALMVLLRSVPYFGDSWLHSLIGSIGYNVVDVPHPFMAASVLLLVLVAIVSEPLRAWQGLIFSSAAVTTGIVAILAIYLSFSAVGSPVAEGVQGRYFVPLLMPLAIGLRSLLPLHAEMPERALRIVVPAVSTSVLIGGAGAWILVLY